MDAVAISPDEHTNHLSVFFCTAAILLENLDLSTRPVHATLLSLFAPVSELFLFEVVLLAFSPRGQGS